MIHCQVTTKDNAWKGLFTFVYAHNQSEKRTSLWSDLQRFQSGIQLPGTVAGDLNVVLSSTEKWNEDQGFMQVGTELVMYCRPLGCLITLGPKFTWTNSHTFCKLDRILVNNIWMNSQRDSTVQFLPAGASDHSPGILRVFKHFSKRAIPFRFKNVWVEDEKFLDIVAECWNTSFQGCKCISWFRSLKLLRML